MLVWAAPAAAGLGASGRPGGLQQPLRCVPSSDVAIYPFQVSQPQRANIPREGANLASRILGGKVGEDPLHTEILGGCSEACERAGDDADPGPAAIRAAQTGSFCWRQSWSPDWTSTGAKAKATHLPHTQTRPECNTHTHHARGTGPCYVGLSLHVNVAAHGGERTRGLVVV